VPAEAGEGDMEKESYDVDIDAQKVNFEGEWMTKDELAEKIRKMIDSQDFRIAAAGNALEFLQKTMANIQEFIVKVGPGDADSLQKHAQKAGLETGVFIRQAILAYLAAQPPLEEGGGGAEIGKVSLTTITTEPAKPEDETQAVELTEKKGQESTSKVLVDPSLNAEEHPSGGIATEDTWFKK
jgi:hypothetical protein